MRIITWLAAVGLAASLGACAQPGPRSYQPGEKIVLTDRETGERFETTYGVITVVAALKELRERNYGRAIEITSEALRSESLTTRERSLIHVVRAVAYRMLNDRMRARVDLDAALTHDPRNSLAWLERGTLNSEQRLYADAISDLTRAIEIRPTPDAYSARGRAHFLLNNYTAAHADFEQAIALRPDFGNAYLLRGLTYHATGAYALARADYLQALTIDPGNDSARRALALLQRRAPAPRAPAASPPNPIQHF